jgi:hypothetical protein
MGVTWSPTSIPWEEVRAVDAPSIQFESDNLRLGVPEGMEVIVVAGGPAVAGMAVREQAAVDQSIFYR